MLLKSTGVQAFRHAPNLKDNLVRAKLPQLHGELVQGCFRCGMSRCQICKSMVEGHGFRCMVSGTELKISSSSTSDSSVVYLLGCTLDLIVRIPLVVLI